MEEGEAIVYMFGYIHGYTHKHTHNTHTHQAMEEGEATVDMLGFRGTPRRVATAEERIKELEDILWKEKRQSKRRT